MATGPPEHSAHTLQDTDARVGDGVGLLPDAICRCGGDSDRSILRFDAGVRYGQKTAYESDAVRICSSVAGTIFVSCDYQWRLRLRPLSDALATLIAAILASPTKNLRVQPNGKPLRGRSSNALRRTAAITTAATAIAGPYSVSTSPSPRSSEFRQPIAFFRRPVGWIAGLGSASADAVLQISDARPGRKFAGAGFAQVLAVRRNLVLVHAHCCLLTGKQPFGASIGSKRGWRRSAGCRPWNGSARAIPGRSDPVSDGIPQKQDVFSRPRSSRSDAQPQGLRKAASDLGWRSKPVSGRYRTSYWFGRRPAQCARGCGKQLVKSARTRSG